MFPNVRIHLETPGCKPAMRIVDLVSPIGKGQRGMIVSQPKAGKTTLLKQIAHAVNKNHPEMHMIILLIDTYKRGENFSVWLRIFVFPTIMSPVFKFIFLICIGDT